MVVNSNIITQDTEEIINPMQRPTVTHELSENVILTT
ncbi:NADH-quinone oxidoreductase subunit B, partial [Dolichospermum sp. ST_con]|nr:NADH-quinone oxidoreductase subunit B [Dolichospermum sp. ST_con]